MTVEITLSEKLARAVLLFHGGEIWSDDQRYLWRICTGSDDATTKVLGDLAREVLADEERTAEFYRRQAE